MDTQEKQITKNASKTFFIIGMISFIIICICTVALYPFIYNMNETAARIIMTLPLIFCAIISFIFYKRGTSAAIRELSAFILLAGIVASLLLFKSFCSNDKMFYYTYGAMPYLLALSALAAIIIFDCLVPLVFYSSLAIVLCILAFTSEYTVFLIPASLVFLAPVFIYTSAIDDRKDYRRYLSRFISADAVILSVVATIGEWVVIPASIIVIAATIFLFRKFNVEKANFTVGLRRSIAATSGIACVLSAILGTQLYYSYHLNLIRSQSVSAVYEIEKLEIGKNKVLATLKSEELNDIKPYSDEKYALITPKEGEDLRYCIERYSDTQYSRNSAFVIAKYLNGTPIVCSNTYYKEGFPGEAAGVYESDDWNSAYVRIYIDYKGVPVFFYDNIELSGNETLEKLFDTDY